MALLSSDIVWYPSLTGSSEGGAMGGTPITSAVDNNLWPDLNAADLLAGGTRYRKIFVSNDSGADTWIEPVVWLTLEATNIVEHLGLGIDSSDDIEADGGALTQFGANAVLQIVSDGADTRTVTVYGVDDSSDPATEVMVVDGTNGVSSVTIWSKVWGVFVDSISGSRTITVKEGAGGTTRGTIPSGLVALWVWVEAVDKASGIQYVDVGAGENIGVWRRQVWDAATSGVRPNDNRIKAEEA